MSSASISFAGPGSLRVWRPVGQCGPRRSCSQSPGASSPRSRHEPHPAQEGTSRGEEARRPRVLAHPGGAYGDGIAQAAPGAQATLYMSPVSEPENLHKQRVWLSPGAATQFGEPRSELALGDPTDVADNCLCRSSATASRTHRTSPRDKARSLPPPP